MQRPNSLGGIRKSLAFASLLAILAAGAATAQEESFRRAGKANPNLFASGYYLTDQGFSINTAGGGVGMGYNLTDTWGWSTEAIFANTGVKGSDSSGMTYAGLVNLECDFLKSRFTPLATVGIGGIGFDLGGDNPKYSGAGFLYGGGVGFRYDITDDIFLRATYRVFGATVGGLSVMQGVTVSFGFSF